MKEVLAIIQARGGSKAIPGKNIKPLAGKPLIAWTILQAQKSKLITRLIVSTDDNQIASISKKYGAEVPFLRPKKYATDRAKSLGVLQHALNWLAKNEDYQPDLVVQLKPVNPLRRAQHIDKCIQTFLKSKNIDSVITVTETPAHPLKSWKFKAAKFLTPFVPESVYHIKEAAKLPRQMLPPAFVNNSCVHVISPQTILKKNSTLGTQVKGVVMSQADSINIDTQLDFALAEILIKQNKKYYAN
jgi:CMP-N-acetylneuraminic acid synthetase